MFLLARVLLHMGLCALVGLTGRAVHAQQAGETVHIELRADAIVSRRYVTLADVAAVRTSDPQVRDMLNDLRISPAPRIGYVERLSRAELDHVTRTRLAEIGSRAEWSGARFVSIRSMGRTVDVETMVDAARTHLLKELGSRYQQLDVHLASPLGGVDLPLGEVRFKPRPVDAKHVYPRMPVWVDIYVDGTAYRSVVVPFTVKASQPVYVARRDLPEGAVVSANDFESRLQDASPRISDAVAVPDMQDAMRMRKTLAAGHVLTHSHVSQHGTVLRGDTVKLVLAAGGVVIETLALVQQDGVIGQLVKVKAEKSVNAIVGRVVSPGVVMADGR